MLDSNTPSNDDEIDLNYVKGIRKKSIEALIEGGVPTSNIGKMNTLSKLLADMDMATLSKMRIKVDDKTADVTAQTQQILLSLMANPEFKEKTHADNLTARKSPMPTLPSDVVYTPKPGEMDQEVSDETFATFSIRNTKSD